VSQDGAMFGQAAAMFGRPAAIFGQAGSIFGQAGAAWTSGWHDLPAGRRGFQMMAKIAITSSWLVTSAVRSP
jgi:hypothetical protein